MFNWLPAEQREPWCVGFFLQKCYHFHVLLTSSGSFRAAARYSGVCFPPGLNTNEGHLLVFFRGLRKLSKFVALNSSVDCHMSAQKYFQ